MQEPPPQPKLAARIDALRETYAALNRSDGPGFIRLFDADIERVEEFPSGHSCRGIEAFTEHVIKARATWAEGSCEPQQFAVLGDRIIVYVNVRVRLKNETTWHEGRVFDVFTFRNGKVTQFRSFIDESRAMQWAGGPAAYQGNAANGDWHGLGKGHNIYGSPAERPDHR